MSSSLTADPKDSQQNDLPFEETDAQENTPRMSSTTSKGPCLQLKGSLVPMTVLELTYFDAEQFRADLHAKTAQAPDFFENLPVVIGLEKFEDHNTLSFEKLIEICKSQSIKVVAVRGGSEVLQSLAKQAGLGLLAKQKERTQTEKPAQPERRAEQQEQADPTPTVETRVETVEVVKTIVEKERQVSKVVQHTVRSGQQVYAADGDLIVIGSVSAGAEILADGNIHVYGTLRGRALAGVKGDTKARVFCHQLAAELISIAGQYKISEDIEKSMTGRAVQAYLDKDALRFKEIEL